MVPHSAQSVAALSLDVGGTLLQPFPSVGAVYAKVLQRHGFTVEAGALQTRFKTAFQQNRRSQRLTDRDFWEKLVAEVFQPWVPAARFPEIFEDCYTTFAEGSSWQIVKGAKALMTQARRAGWKVVAFSNNDSRLHQVMRETGLAPLCDDIFVSAEMGAEKPSPASFQIVEERLKLPPEVLLHVGDDAVADAEGATRAGWRALLLDKEKGSALKALPFPGSFQMIRELADLTDWIAT